MGGSRIKREEESLQCRVLNVPLSDRYGVLFDSGGKSHTLMLIESGY